MHVRRFVLVGVASVAALGGGVLAATYQLDAASVEARPSRDVQFDPGATCDLTTVTELSARHPAVRQFIVAATPGFSATTGPLSIAVRASDGRWLCQRGEQVARFGRSGTRPLSERRSGDGTTPAGVFPLGLVTAWDGQEFSMFGNAPDPGVQVPYRDVRVEDCWGATANTSRYQRLVNRPYCPGPDDEWLAGITGAYAHAAVIGANLDPISGDEPGETPYAAAIFLHRFSYSGGVSKPTSGCISLAYDDLVATLQLIDPDLRPHFAIGPRDWLRSTA